MRGTPIQQFVQLVFAVTSFLPAQSLVVIIALRTLLLR